MPSWKKKKKNLPANAGDTDLIPFTVLAPYNLMFGRVDLKSIPGLP